MSVYPRAAGDLHRVALGAIALIVWITACSGGDDATPTTPGAPELVPTFVEISSAQIAFTSLGETEQLTATVKDQNGSVLSTAQVAWASTDSSVVSVSSTGLVTAIQAGTASIQAVSGTASATAQASVEQVVRSIALDVDTVKFSSLADSVLLVATARDASGATVSGADLAWTSSDSGVASVASGVVRPVADGSAVISVSSAQVSAAVEVVVRLDRFFLASNGVTVRCPQATLGDTATVKGKLYTKVDLSQLKARIASGDASAVAASCTSGIRNMTQLFDMQETFNADISTWDVSSVESMRCMFCGAAAFNQDLGAWDVSNVSDMDAMFFQSWSFDSDISGWNVSNVRRMALMFNSTSFDQDLSGWDVSSVVEMRSMFEMSPFSADISSWNVSNVTNMDRMFAMAGNFNADLSGWCVESIEQEPSGFSEQAESWTLPHPVWGSCSRASVRTSVVTAVPSVLPPDGVSTSAITVRLRDAAGVEIAESLGSLSFQSPSRGRLSPVVDNGDGTYATTYTAGNARDTVLLVPELDGGRKSLAALKFVLGEVPASVELAQDSVRLMGFRDTLTLVPTVRDASNAVIEDATVQWTSSDTAVVAVLPTGTMVSMQPGTVTVIATSRDASAAVEVTVEFVIPESYPLYKEAYFNQRSGVFFWNQQDAIGFFTNIDEAWQSYSDGVGYHDVNGDGLQDLLITNTSDYMPNLNSVTSWYINDGLGGFQKDESYLTNPRFSGASHKILKTDVNNDGLADFILLGVWEPPVGDYGGNFHTLVQNEEGRFDVIETDSGTGLWYHMGGAGDLNGDGFVDVVSATYLWLGDGTGNFSNTGIDLGSLYGGPAVTQYEIVDLNGDGWNDVVLGTSNESGGKPSVVVFNNEGSFDSSNRFFVLPEVRTGSTGDFEFVDIDEDGDLDIVEMFRPSGMTATELYVYLNHGDSFEYVANLIPDSFDGNRMHGDLDLFGWTIFKFDDVDYDGIDDIVAESFMDGPYSGLKKVNGTWVKWDFRPRPDMRRRQ